MDPYLDIRQSGPGRKIIRKETREFNIMIHQNILRYGDKFHQLKQKFSMYKMCDFKNLIKALKDVYKIKIPHLYTRTKNRIIVWLLDNWHEVSSLKLFQNIFPTQTQQAIANVTCDNEIQNDDEKYPDFDSFIELEN